MIHSFEMPPDGKAKWDWEEGNPPDLKEFAEKVVKESQKLRGSEDNKKPPSKKAA